MSGSAPSHSTSEQGAADVNLVGNALPTPFVTDRRVRFPRQPAVPVALCFAVGIALDRWLSLPWTTWLAVGVALACGWATSMGASDGRLLAPREGASCRARRLLCRERRGVIFLLACCLCLGGARHHVFWSVAPADDIFAFTSDERRPVRLTGTIATQPFIRVRETDTLRAAWAQVDDTVCMLRCRSLETGAESIPVSGLARLSVSGHLLHVEVGDRVEVRGWLSRPRAAANPGQFDFQDYIRRQGTRSLIRAHHPDAIRRLPRGEGGRFQRELGRLRDEGELLFVEHLGPRTVPVASALFWGNRSNMTDELRSAFAQSGMMHVLAISGLHVGILAGFLWLGCRLLNLSPWATSAVILTVVVGYALVTHGRPPVVRATVLVFVAAVGRPWYRRALPENSLAIAALLLLAWNPSDLFDVGAQLSFLAVLAIIWSASWRSSQAPAGAGRGMASLLDQQSLARRRLGELGVWLKQGYGMVAAIWLVTAPLVAAHFHLVSPIGLLINVLLIPLVVLVLWCGYGLIFCGFLLPPAAPVFGFGLDRGLEFLLGLVEGAGRFELGHRYVPGPPLWWLVGYYGLLAAVVYRPTLFRVKRRGWIALLAWTVLGLAVGLVPARPNGVHCTILSVGHGCAVLVELPNGKTLLYDAGAIPDGQRAQQTVQAALWDRRLSRIDAVVLSHPDIDHFNALPGLMRTVPVGCVLVAPSFFDFDQEAVEELCEAAAEAGVPIRVIWEGDRLRIDETVAMDILHPTAEQRFDHDNANSVVLDIHYAGRRVLLTGDVEDEGLDQLLTLPALKTDVMLAPHHGSLRANPPELAAWADPEFVVVSGSRRELPPQLREIYGRRTRVVSTVESGAVRVEIERDGRMQVRGEWFGTRNAEFGMGH